MVPPGLLPSHAIGQGGVDSNHYGQKDYTVAYFVRLYIIIIYYLPLRFISFRAEILTRHETFWNKILKLVFSVKKY